METVKYLDSEDNVSALSALLFSSIYRDWKKSPALLMLQVSADQHSAQVFTEASSIVPNQTADSTYEFGFLWNKIMTDNLMNQTLLTPIMMNLPLSYPLSPSYFLALCIFFVIVFSSFPLTSLICIISPVLPLLLCQQGHSLLEQGLDNRQANFLCNSNNSLQQCLSQVP